MLGNNITIKAAGEMAGMPALQGRASVYFHPAKTCCVADRLWHDGA
jgi:hypothetical protein